MNCGYEAKQVRLAEKVEAMKDRLGIDLSKSLVASHKRGDCTSPMCWFRPGKRNSYNHLLNKAREMNKSDRSCKSPMCWFRGKRRSGKIVDMATKKAAWKHFLQKIKALKGNKARQVSEDGCNSPMCWFRPGREANTLDYGKTLNYVREVNAIKEAVKKELGKQFQSWGKKESKETSF